MDYTDFYDIATYGNGIWKGSFTEREIAQNAYDYKVEYDYSIEQGKPTHTMVELCKLIVEDMDIEDYVDCPNELDVETMKRIISDLVNEI